MSDTYKATVCVGWQPDSNVWVFNDKIQINAGGNVINEEGTLYVFMKHMFESDNTTSQGHTRSCNSSLPSISLPLSYLTLGDVVKSLHDTLHHNGMARIFTIGMLFTIYALMSKTCFQ